MSAKIFCALIGLLFFGPFGAILGFFIGANIDVARHRGGGYQGFRDHFKQGFGHFQKAFFEATFIFMGYIAKSDGRITQEEIRVAETVMDRLNLSKLQRQEAMKLFYKGKNRQFDFTQVLEGIKPYKNLPHMHTFLSVLQQMAMANHGMTQQQQRILLDICQHLGVQVGQQRGHAGGGHHHVQKRDPYKILGISPSANEKEIRKAYRRLMSKHHPDKLAARGATEQEIQEATEKTTDIRQAYETAMERKGAKY